MSDPMASLPDPLPLFTSTSAIAGQAAARSATGRRARILADLERHGPSTLIEVSDRLGVFYNQISGRFTALCADGFIERTGDQRPNPKTGVPCDVWRLRRSASTSSLADQLGYPITLLINGELFDRQELLPTEGWPGIPYARRGDTGGLRQIVRVELPECGHCGRPLMRFEEAGQVKVRCNHPGCAKTWRVRGVAAPGRAAMLALVMEEF